MMRYIALSLLLITSLLGNNIEESLQEHINELAQDKALIQKLYTEHIPENQAIRELENTLTSELDNLESLINQPVASPELGRLLEKGYNLAQQVKESSLPNYKTIVNTELSLLQSILLKHNYDSPTEVPEENSATVEKKIVARTDYVKAVERERKKYDSLLNVSLSYLNKIQGLTKTLEELTVSRMLWFKNSKPLWQLSLFKANRSDSLKEQIPLKDTIKNIEYQSRNPFSIWKLLGFIFGLPVLGMICLQLIKRINRDRANGRFLRVITFLIVKFSPVVMIYGLAYYISQNISPVIVSSLIAESLKALGHILFLIISFRGIHILQEKEINILSFPPELIHWIQKVIITIILMYFTLIKIPDITNKHLTLITDLKIFLNLTFTLFLAIYLSIYASSKRLGYPKYLFKGNINLKRNWDFIRTFVFLTFLGAAVLGILGYHFAWNYIQVATLKSLTLLTLISLFYTGIREALLEFSNRLTRHKKETARTTAEIDDESNQELKKEWERHERTKIFVDKVFSVLVLLSMALIWNAEGVFQHALSKVVLYKWVAGESTFFLTLYGVTAAALIMAISIFLVKALPPFLELFIFPKFDIDGGVRYAVISMTRYIAYAIAFFMSLSYLQVDLSKIGWLVAALGLGLGFGLQEIVSNFVCGLILLIERPIRVGDIVTIDGITGNVTKINMRSSTITDWDKLENVIPNKTFITQKLKNWSLSNQLSRVIIPIGVAYGSNPVHIKNLLLDVATSNPNVMDDPAPQALFLNHGASSLDFELRAYLNDFSTRVYVQDALVTKLNETLVKEGIEIPYPQQDIHIRSNLGVSK